MFNFKKTGSEKIKKRKFRFLLFNKLISKRQRLILSVVVLSLGLFISENILGKSSLSVVFLLSILTTFFLYFSLQQDLEDNFNVQVFILPFFYSLSVGLFYLLIPARFLTKMLMTTLYAFGLYSLFLSQNIFTVSSIRTIALLSGARTVSLVLTLLSYFFLSNVVFSFHINIFLTLLIIFIYTFPIVLQSIWIHTLEKNLFAQLFWVLSLTICLVEISAFLWLRPGSPTVLALFLTAIFYILVGLTQAWFEKRLFRGVIIEYVWITLISFIFLIFFSNWG